MKGFNNFQLALLVCAIVAAIFAVIWANQRNAATEESSCCEVLEPASDFRSAPPSEDVATRTLSATEVRNRFSGQIVEGVHEIRNFTFIHYYGPDGVLISIRSDRGRNGGTWRVGSDGRLCIHLDGDDEICAGLIEFDGLTKKFVKTRRGHIKIVVTYKSFRTGRPDEL